jgi:TRAP-type C4-dicarboxylate transport system substrate-binding protein
MQRSLILAAAMAAAMLSVTMRPVTADPIVLKFSHFLGPASFFQTDVVEPWAKELEAKTNGQVKVEIFNASSPLGKPTEQANQVKAGTVDIALGLRGAEGDKFPGTSIIELPFLVPNALAGSRALWGFYADGTLADEYKDYKVLALFVHNPGLIHTANNRVVNLTDLKGLRFRVPNKTVAAALEHVGATPVVLQVNEVMDAVKAGRIDGIVTNWGNPLQGFNDYMKFHTDTQFYTAAFFIVMNREKYQGLPANVRRAVDEMSGEAWSIKFIVPDAATMAAWREGLQPVTERYLADLAAHGFPNARAAYDKLAGALRR